MEALRPDHTPMPDWMVDELMPAVSGEAFMLASFIVRHSLGNGHQEVKFSNQALAYLSGLTPQETAKGIYELLESNYFLRRSYQDAFAYRVCDVDHFTRIFGLAPQVFDPGEKSPFQ